MPIGRRLRIRRESTVGVEAVPSSPFKYRIGDYVLLAPAEPLLRLFIVTERRLPVGDSDEDTAPYYRLFGVALDSIMGVWVPEEGIAPAYDFHVEALLSSLDRITEAIRTAIDDVACGLSTVIKVSEGRVTRDTRHEAEYITDGSDDDSGEDDEYVPPPRRPISGSQVVPNDDSDEEEDITNNPNYRGRSWRG